MAAPPSSPYGGCWGGICHTTSLGVLGDAQAGTPCPYSVVAVGGLRASCLEPEAILRGDTPGEGGSEENEPHACALFNKASRLVIPLAPVLGRPGLVVPSRAAAPASRGRVLCLGPPHAPLLGSRAEGSVCTLACLWGGCQSRAVPCPGPPSCLLCHRSVPGLLQPIPGASRHGAGSPPSGCRQPPISTGAAPLGVGVQGEVQLHGTALGHGGVSVSLLPLLFPTPP